MAMFAPMPIANAATATAVNPGDLRRSRTPCRRSCTTLRIIRLSPDYADCPCGLPVISPVCVLHRGQEHGQGSRIADRTERPGCLLPHFRILVAQGAAQPVD